MDQYFLYKKKTHTAGICQSAGWSQTWLSANSLSLSPWLQPQASLVPVQKKESKQGTLPMFSLCIKTPRDHSRVTGKDRVTMTSYWKHSNWSCPGSFRPIMIQRSDWSSLFSPMHLWILATKWKEEWGGQPAMFITHTTGGGLCWEPCESWKVSGGSQ